jgi:hypothetical protein
MAIERTREYRNTQPLELRFRALLTEDSVTVPFHRDSPAGLSEPYV